MIIDEKSDIKTLVVPCSKCGYAQSGTVHGSFDVSDKEVYDHAGRLFFLVQCPGCKSPFLLYVDWGCHTFEKTAANAIISSSFAPAG